jgi:hypothetical protein
MDSHGTPGGAIALSVADLLFPTLPAAVHAYQDRTKDPPAGNQGP